MSEKIQWLISAFGLLLVMEGLMPFTTPRLWRQTMQQILSLSNVSIRTFGLVLMLVGTGIIWLIHQ